MPGVNVDTLIRAHVDRGEYMAAADLCRQWRGHFPDSPDALHESGGVALLVGDAAGAIGFFRAADAVRPSASTRFHLAYAHLLERDFTAAEAVCRSIASAPDISPQKLANVQEMLGDIALVRSIAPLPAVTGREGPRDAWEQAAASAMDTLQPHAGLSVVFFHVGGTLHPFRKVTVDYTGILLESMRAARAQHPDAAIVLLTDMITDTSAIAGLARVARCDLDANFLMYSRMRSYRALAMTGKLTGAVLFLDTDVHLHRPFTPIFTGDFDVGLTYRNEVGQWHMPVNEGVMLASSGAAPALRRFFDATLTLYETLAATPAAHARYGFDVRRWRGGQLSLAKFIDWSTPPLAPDLRDIAGVRVKFLPCTEYNYTVRKGVDPAALVGKWALHYKGDVKVAG